MKSAKNQGCRSFAGVARGATGLLVVALFGAASPLVGCVRPSQRAVLADPTMRFDDREQAVRQHALENREGSMGGGSVQGGGCGCN